MSEEQKKQKKAGCGNVLADVLAIVFLFFIGHEIVDRIAKRKENTIDDTKIEIRDSGELSSFLKITFGASIDDEVDSGSRIENDIWYDEKENRGFDCLSAEVHLDRPLLPIPDFDVATIFASIESRRVFGIGLRHRGPDATSYPSYWFEDKKECIPAFAKMMENKYGLKGKDDLEGHLEYKYKNVLVRYSEGIIRRKSPLYGEGIMIPGISVVAVNTDLEKLAKQEAHNANVLKKKNEAIEAENRANEAAKSGLDLL